MKKFKSILKRYCPPIFIDFIRDKLKRGIRFEGNYLSWHDAKIKTIGYDDKLILKKVLDSTLQVKNGHAVFERDSVIFNEIQYSLPVAVGIMLAAVRSNGELYILDFGGALGSSYFQNKKFIDQLKEVQWSIVEQENFVEAGIKYIENETLKFHSSIEDSVSHKIPNCIILGSVLQYIENLNDLLIKINNIKADILIIDRTPFTSNDQERICLQFVPAEIYESSYPVRLISRSKLINILTNWIILERFDGIDSHIYGEFSYKFNFSSYVFIRKENYYL